MGALAVTFLAVLEVGVVGCPARAVLLALREVLAAHKLDLLPNQPLLLVWGTAAHRRRRTR